MPTPRAVTRAMRARRARTATEGIDGDLRRWWGMLRRPRLLVLSLLAFTLPACATSTPARAPLAAAEESSVDIPFTLQEGGNIVVSVTVNGRPARFLVDSGASATVLAPGPAAAAGVSAHGAVETEGGGGHVSGVRAGLLASLVVGGWELRQLSVAVMKLGVAGDYDGVLGNDVLHQRLVEIDFPHARLRLHPQGPALRQSFARTMTRLPATTTLESLMVVQVDLDRKGAIPAVVDLGATSSVVNTRAGAGAKVLGHGQAAGIDGAPIPADLCAFQSLALGAVRQDAPQLVVADMPVFASFGLMDRPAMILGLDVLRSMVVVIDYGGRAVYLARG